MVEAQENTEGRRNVDSTQREDRTTQLERNHAENSQHKHAKRQADGNIGSIEQGANTSVQGVESTGSHDQRIIVKQKVNSTTISDSNTRAENIIVDDTTSPIIGGTAMVTASKTDSDGFTLVQQQRRELNSMLFPQAIPPFKRGLTGLNN